MAASTSQHTQIEGEIREREFNIERETQLPPNHRPMDPDLYRAVKDADVEYLNQPSTDLFDNQLTRNHSTILHVAAQFGNLDCVAKILGENPCHLIQQVNLNKENPLHVAVKDQHYGADEEKRKDYYRIVLELIKGATGLEQDPERGVPAQLHILRATNVDGDTPLHLAVRGGESTVVSLLAYTDADFQHTPNEAKETPLYLAAERNNGDFMVETILARCKSPTYTGPYGRTALHAAVISGNIVSLKKLLDRYKNLIDEADAQGWTPLHYAAYCRDKNAVRELLERDKLVGYTRSKEKHDKGLALHIAAAAGHDDVMEEILYHCPDCWEMVNGKGQNILHIAVDRETECVIHFIIQMGMLESLMNQKDVKGDTPLHLLASSTMMNMDDIINHPRANMYVVNNRNKTPAEVAMSIKQNNGSSWFSKAHCWRNIGSNEEHKAKMTEDLLMEPERKESKEVKAKNKAAQSHMLVATLIATITFAAGFTIPGGYQSQGLEEGMAVLMRKAGFIVFGVFNTIAVMCSTSSVLTYAIATLCKDDKKKAICYMKGFGLVIIAIIAMTVGFLSGTYAILVHSHIITIVTSVTASTWLLIYLIEPIWFALKYILSFRGKN